MVTEASSRMASQVSNFAERSPAQAATSRLLYSMSRDRQLPSFLSKVSARQVPIAAILAVPHLTIRRRIDERYC